MRVSDGVDLGPTAWDGLLLAQPAPSLLQSWAWGELQSRFGWRVERLVFEDGDAGVCSLQRARSVLPGGAIFYVPRGPAVQSAARGDVLGLLTERARRGGGLTLRIEPDAVEGDPWADALTQSGFRPRDAVQPRASQLLRIDEPPEVLKAGFKPKTRYNLSLGERKGVTAEVSQDVEAFARLAQETAGRQAIRLPGAAYYRAALEIFGPEDRVRLYLARHDGRILAGIMVFRFGSTAYYLYGGSAQTGRPLMPSYVLHWTAMLDFRSLGCSVYDWWGIPEQARPDHPWFGLYRFKTGFGGETVRYIGLYERSLRPARWRLEARLRKLKRRLRGSILG